MHARMYSVMCHYSDSERSCSRSSCDSEIPGQENKFRVDEISGIVTRVQECTP